MATAWDDTRPPELDLIKDCVHCGFCLPTCPSYAVFEDEMDSPRGRIVLMRIGHEEGSDDLAGDGHALRPLPRLHGVRDRVPVRRPVRQADRAQRGRRSSARRRARGASAPTATAIFALFTHPGAAARARSRLQARRRSSRRWCRSRAWRRCSRSRRRGDFRRLPEVTTSKAPASGAAGRVHAGLHPARVLRRRQRRHRARAGRRGLGGPRAAQAALLRRAAAARRRRGRGASSWRARRSRRTRASTTIVVNVAGCGSAMKDYGHLLRRASERAEAFSAKVVDVHELLADGRAAGRAQPDPAARRLPRRLPPRPRPGSARRSRASCCAASPASSCSSRPSGSCAAARPASTTCCSPRPPPSSARARRRTCAPPAPRRSPPPTRAARCRSPRTCERCRSTTR